MSVDDAAPAAEDATRLFDETSTPEFAAMRRRLLRYYRLKSGAIGTMIIACLAFGVFFLLLPSAPGTVSPRGALFIALAILVTLLFRRNLDTFRRQATQAVVLREDKLLLRNLPPSRRGDLEIPLDSIVRVELVVAPKVGPGLGIRCKDGAAEKDVSHYCHLVVDRQRLRMALSLALPGRVSGRGWDPPEKTPGRAARVEVSHINR